MTILNAPAGGSPPAAATPRRVRRPARLGAAFLPLLLLAACLAAGAAAPARANTYDALYPYNIESLVINPLTSDTSTKQFVLGVQVTRDWWEAPNYNYDGKYRLKVGYNLVNPSSPQQLEYGKGGGNTVAWQRLNIANGPEPSGKNDYSYAVPGIANEMVSASRGNPGARANPGNPVSRPNYMASHVTAPLNVSAYGRGILWTVITPTGTEPRDATFSNSSAATYLNCDKYFITPALLGGTVTADANAVLTTTPDGQCLMATTIVKNPGTTSAKTWIAVYQLSGGRAPDVSNLRTALGMLRYRNGPDAYPLFTNAAQGVRLVALVEPPTDVLATSSADWNGNIAMCVTRNHGDAWQADPTDGHDEGMVVWLGMYSKQRGTQLTHFRLGYDFYENLRGYRNNHRATAEFRRNDIHTPLWQSFSARVPADAAALYRTYFRSFGDANNLGMLLKTGIDGRAHLFYMGQEGKVFEEVYSYGNRADGTVGYVFHWSETGGSVRQQFYQYYDSAPFSDPKLVVSPYDEQIAPLLFSYGQATETTPSNAGGSAGLTTVQQPVFRMTVSVFGSLWAWNNGSNRAKPLEDAVQHGTMVRQAEDWNGDRTLLIPVGFIDGPPPYPNENLAGTTSDAPFLMTRYAVGSGTTATNESVSDTGVSLNTSVNAQFVVGVSLDMDAAWKRSRAMQTDRTIVYDKTFTLNVGPVPAAGGGRKVTPVGTVICRRARMGAYQFYLLYPNNQRVPESASVRLVLGNVPGYEGDHALDAYTFDLDTSGATAGAVKPGDISSYLMPFTSSTAWEDLLDLAVQSTEGAPVRLTSSWDGPTSTNQVVRYAAAKTLTTSRTEDFSYMAGLNVNLPGFTAQVKAGQSYSVRETTAFSNFREVTLETSIALPPTFTPVTGKTYNRIAWATVLLAPDTRWTGELVSHLQKNPTTRNQQLLAGLFPTAGIFKITYRIDQDTDYDYRRD